jgi:hypothetical protein
MPSVGSIRPSKLNSAPMRSFGSVEQYSTACGPHQLTIHNGASLASNLTICSRVCYGAILRFLRRTMAALLNSLNSAHSCPTGPAIAVRTRVEGLHCLTKLGIHLVCIVATPISRRSKSRLIRPFCRVWNIETYMGTRLLRRRGLIPYRSRTRFTPFRSRAPLTGILVGSTLQLSTSSSRNKAARLPFASRNTR